MFPLLALLLLLPLGHTQKTTSTPTKVSVLEHIFPPYRGPASYFASVVAIEDQITTLAMTCLQPTSWPTPDPLSRDPCDTSSLGIRSQTITQGNGTWGVEHGTTLGEEYWTRCQRMSGSLGPSATENPFDASSLYCSARYSASGFPPLTEEGVARVRFGLSTQLVTVTAGFDVLGEPLETASSRTGRIQVERSKETPH
ncbi:hypothetical protein BU24DRAFT_410544 [Aaosphaeria arxii CBS 175.79]|uniref:Uncharacterized protein n=1 Tax=Aaosphaeria arxii CBS 175.79 TaxID=1450172 RepID=A0A6A5XNX4_9PLEO|nr:uncharacterized protein BU24DRAFT_410544 [Aaosphaeria arxii CBS 175.79]KAF2014842.1 hypothetical protein BU24DRAFT_410544 [Aaosphaeria arxii CBS 175.79]